MFINKYNYYIIGLFCMFLFVVLLFFSNAGNYTRKIQSGTIKAKITLPSRTEMRGEIVHIVCETYIFMVQKDSITEKFEVSKEKYETLQVGDVFELDI